MPEGGRADGEAESLAREVKAPDLTSELVIGRHIETLRTVLPELETLAVVASVDDHGVLRFLNEHPLTALEFSANVSAPQYLAEYDPICKSIVVNPFRPAESYGHQLEAELTPSISYLGKDLVEAMQRSLYHELAHHIESECGLDIVSVITAAGRSGRLCPLTRRARVNAREYFAEVFSAYRFEGDILFFKDPEGYVIIEQILKTVGLL